MLLAATPAVPASTAAAAPPTTSLSATPLFRHYSIDQGLPNSYIYTVVQDDRGAIWAGTISGLARFDGSKFKTYRHVPGDANSLTSNDTSTILVDSKGRVWTGGAGSGVNLYQPSSDDFRHFRHDPHRADSLADNNILTMTEGQNGTLWVGTFEGLDHMTSPGHFEHFTHDPDNPHSLASNIVFSLRSCGKGCIWVGTNKGLDMLEPDGSVRHVRFQGLDHAPTIWSIDGDAHQIRAATSQGLFVVNANAVAKRMYPDMPEHLPVLSSVRDKHGDMWLGTSRGLYLIHDARIFHFPARPFIPGGQPGQMIWKVMLDNEGGLWLATRNNGLAYLRPDWHEFSHYSHRPGDTDSLNHSHVMAVASDGHGHLWVGGGRGNLDKLDPATGSVTHFKDKLGSEPSHEVIAIARAGKHGLWLGYGRSLSLLDHGHLQTVIKPLSGSGFQRLASDTDGNVYASAMPHGVYRVDRQTLQYQTLGLGFPGRSGRRTLTMLMHNGHLWRASSAGVSYLPSHSLQLVPIKGVAPGHISAMAMDGNDLWLSRSTELDHYRLHDHQATLLQRIDDATGWPGLVVYAMTVDHRGRIWLFAAAGLWRYDPATHQFKRYGKNDGLPSPVFTIRQLARIGTDTVFAGTMNGVVGFHPDAINDHPRKPRLEIASIVVRRDGKDVTLSPDTRDLHLDWNDHDLRITAHAMSYIDPSRNHYRFRLVGLDNGWVDTGTHGMRELAGLSAGSYRLEVQAAGPSGVWSHLATPITIDVDAPPWLRPWAWLLYALAILAASYGIIAAWRRRLEQRHHVQMAHQQQHMAEQANAAKTRFLATLSHEIRTPMTGVLGMAELLLDANLATRERGRVETIRRSGQMLLKLVNEALDMARIEAGRLVLEAAPMDLRALIEEVRQLQTGQIRDKDMDVLTHVDADVPGRLEGDATRIKQILLNLTNNAIKFTPHGSVAVTATYIQGELQLCVS
ncbi:MAG TPA: two-component regulator propeller domain-containing protein, partial [Oleiagrimonas sp.]|nr:two-component regulator propeller domain-containing protein [Oleiagrimonas sp.]